MICLLPALLSLAAPAQAQQYPLRYYPPEALPQPTVQDLLRDRQGFLWLGTQDGVVRYDGHDFVSFGQDQGLRSGWINDLVEDGQGRIWVATDDGVGVEIGGRFAVVSEAEGLPARRVTHLAVDGERVVAATTDGLASLTVGPDGPVIGPLDAGRLVATRVTALVVAEGRLWVGTDVDGMHVVGPDGVEVVDTVQGLPGRRAGPIVVRNGVSWIATEVGLARWDGKTMASWNELQGADVRGLAMSPDGPLYVSTADGWILRIADPEGSGVAEPIDRGPPVPIDRLLLDRAGVLWGATPSAGLVRFDTRTGDDAVIDTRHGLGADDITSLLEDDEQNLWVGTGVGLHRIRPGPLVSFRSVDGLPSDTVWTTRQLSGGALLVGTDAGLAVQLAGRFIPVTGEEVRAIAPVDADTVLVGNRRGVSRLDLRLDPLAPSATATQVEGIQGFPQSNGPVSIVEWNGSYVVGNEVGLFQGQPDGRFVPLVITDGAVRVWGLSVGGDTLWVATDRGIYRVTGAGVTHFGRTEGLVDDAVQTISAAQDGTVWFGYDSSLGIGSLAWPEGKLVVSHWDTRDGLPSDYAYFVGADKRGRVWIGTSKGLARLDANGFSAYDVEDGLAWNDCDHNAFFEDHDGTLWFGTGKGLSRWRPEVDDPKPVPAPPVVITGATLGGEPAEDRAEVPWERRDLEAGFTALSLVAEDATTFRWRLMPYDTTWSAWSDRRTATFTNLPPGTYALEVEARAKDGTVSTSPGRFAFTVDPAFYMTWWFRGLGLAALAGLVGGGWQLRLAGLRRREMELESTVELRTRQLAEEKRAAEGERERAEREKQRAEREKARAEAAAQEVDTANKQLHEMDRLKNKVFEDVSHELRTPLAMVMGPLELMIAGRYGEIPEASKAPLVLMLRNARQLMRQVDQILEIRRLGNEEAKAHFAPVHLGRYMQPITAAIAELCRSRGLVFDTSVDAEDPTVWVDADRFEKIPLNLLSNAVKFTPPGGVIRCTMHDDDESVTLVVQDTGTGIDPGQMPHLFDRYHRGIGLTATGSGIGLALVQELVDLHKGTIEVSSEPAQGTVFRVRLKKGREHLPVDQVVAGSAPEPIPPERRIRAELEGVVFSPQGMDEARPPVAAPDVADVDSGPFTGPHTVWLMRAEKTERRDNEPVRVRIGGGRLVAIDPIVEGTRALKRSGVHIAADHFPMRMTLKLADELRAVIDVGERPDRRDRPRVAGLGFGCVVDGRRAVLDDLCPGGLGLSGLAPAPEVDAHVVVAVDGGRLARKPLIGVVRWVTGDRFGVQLESGGDVVTEVWKGTLEDAIARGAALTGDALVVEDNPDMRQFLAWILERAGMTPKPVASAEEALQAIEGGLRPDLVVVDWMMPGKSGPELIVALRREWAMVELPILMLTARGFTSAQEGLEIGADDFLGKPFSEAELVARVRNLLARR